MQLSRLKLIFANFVAGHKKGSVQTYLEQNCSVFRKHLTFEKQVHWLESSSLNSPFLASLLLESCGQNFWANIWGPKSKLCLFRPCCYECNDIACDNPMDVSCAYIILIGWSWRRTDNISPDHQQFSARISFFLLPTTSLVGLIPLFQYKTFLPFTQMIV